MTFDLAGMSQKVKADCLDLAAEVLDAAKAEIIRLTARVAELEAALQPLADFGAVATPDYQPQIRIDCRVILKARAALSTPTEEPKT